MKFLNSIYMGDCLKLLTNMPSESVDLVVSSPPYNLGKEYEKKRALEIYIEEQTAVLRECVRVLKPTGSIFWQVGSFSEDGMLIPLDIRFFPVLEGLGMIPRNRIAWIRQHGLHAQNKFSARYETILWFTKTNKYKFSLGDIRVPQKYQNKKYHKGEKRGQLSCNPDGKNPGDIWAFRNVKHNHEEQTIHPCQFPEDLIARIVLATTEVDDVVLDPFMGAGTVAVVAKDNGRQFAGAETEEKYYKVALRRLSGEPDERKSFPNLKTLRRYVKRTGDPIEKFRFDLQHGGVATSGDKAKIYPEEHHLAELFNRTAHEEECFGSLLREEPAPEDYFQGGKVKRKPATPRLFED